MKEGVRRYERNIRGVRTRIREQHNRITKGAKEQQKRSMSSTELENKHEHKIIVTEARHEVHNRNTQVKEYEHNQQDCEEHVKAREEATC